MSTCARSLGVGVCLWSYVAAGGDRPHQAAAGDLPVSTNSAGSAPGTVEWLGKQVPFQDVPAATAVNRPLQRYFELRDQIAPTTVEQHWFLARFCGARHLKGQQQAHLAAVVEKQPTHAAARAVLGQRYVDGLWLTLAELKAHNEQKRSLTAGRNFWEPKLKKRVADVGGNDETRRERALDDIRAIRDVAALPSLERVVSSQDDARLGLAVVAALERVADREATLSLARHGVYHSQPSVRTAAATALRRRKQTDFVPPMLGEMFTPVEVRSLVQRTDAGFIVLNSFDREGEAERQQAVVQTMVKIVGDDDDQLFTERAERQARAIARQHDQLVARQNEQTKLMNERVCAALTIATGATVPADPESWWQWWNDRNDMYVREKPLRSRSSSLETTIIVRRCECLAAGTLIPTCRGEVAVEKLLVGDLVLSRHRTTGELAYKPVLATTVRPTDRLTRTRTSVGEYLTSGGHPLLTVDGWKKARDLKPGDRLETLERPIDVLEASQAYDAPTYNLVVADFHTYFVGPGYVVSYDNTLCEPLVNGGAETFAEDSTTK